MLQQNERTEVGGLRKRHKGIPQPPFYDDHRSRIYLPNTNSLSRLSELLTNDADLTRLGAARHLLSSYSLGDAICINDLFTEFSEWVVESEHPINQLLGQDTKFNSLTIVSYFRLFLNTITSNPPLLEKIDDSRMTLTRDGAIAVALIPIHNSSGSRNHPAGTLDDMAPATARYILTQDYSEGPLAPFERFAEIYGWSLQTCIEAHSEILFKIIYYLIKTKKGRNRGKDSGETVARAQLLRCFFDNLREKKSRSNLMRLFSLLLLSNDTRSEVVSCYMAVLIATLNTKGLLEVINTDEDIQYTLTANGFEQATARFDSRSG